MGDDVLLWLQCRHGCASHGTIQAPFACRTDLPFALRAQSKSLLDRHASPDIGAAVLRVVQADSMLFVLMKEGLDA